MEIERGARVRFGIGIVDEFGEVSGGFGAGYCYVHMDGVKRDPFLLPLFLK